MTLPPIVQTPFNRSKKGYAGELGEGANARLKFLQTAISREELDNISLVENIPGSEKWNVRDLFQRDVDIERVNSSILPYLQDTSKVKFFNPLTLVLLPMTAGGDAVDHDVPLVAAQPLAEHGHTYSVFERPGYYRFKVHTSEPAFSDLEWNDQKVRLVAIDGQHRLSALKMWKSQPGESALGAWQIPVVILGVFRANSDKAAANILEIVRKTFIYINSRAEEVNEARRILLDDERVTAVCTQELIQAAHENDCAADSARDKKKVPLLFFDWRGQVRWNKEEGSSAAVTAPAAVKSIEEIHSWLENYLLFDDQEQIVLELDDLVPLLSEQYRSRRVLTHEDAERVRAQYRRLLHPGISALLQDFAPYQDYIAAVRDLEAGKYKNSVAAQHAFYKLRFGTHRAPPGSQTEAVEAVFRNLVEELDTIRSEAFHSLLDKDIGMRAVVSAYSDLKLLRDDWSKGTGSWSDHSKWFVPLVNQVYADGWFKAYDQLDNVKRKTLTHIVYDAAGGIVNYKLQDVPDAFGAVLALLVCQADSKKLAAERQAAVWERYGEPLRATIRKGFRRDVRAELRESFKGTAKQFAEEVNDVADAKVKDRMTFLKKQLVS
jgi:hypothetical protein